MNVLIFEQDFGGHRLTYVRHLTLALAKLGVKAFLWTSRLAPDSPEFKRQIEPHLQHLTVLPLDEPVTGTIRYALARWKSLARALKETQAKHVFIPYVDGLGQIMGAARCVGLGRHAADCEIEGLTMRGGFAYPNPNQRKAFEMRMSMRFMRLAPLARLHMIDPIPWERLVTSDPKAGERLRLAPDPVATPPTLTKSKARELLGIAIEGRYVSCSGVLDGRKGVPHLIRAFVQASLAEDVRLLLVGRAAPEVRELLKNEARPLVDSGRILLMDRYVSDEELDWANLASDLVCTPYPRHIGSASIVIRAAATGRPVLAGDFGWMGRLVPEFDLGWTCPIMDPAAFQNALGQAVEDAASWSPSSKTLAFARYHTVANFQAHLTARLRQRLGLDPSIDLHPWPGVERR